ncbi:uncharacterized protein LOC116663350 [Camelus ferus]|uniref:Uncharacterized protein LOC116663350 n=1 Tax=Camelus ferus TaxID=419612 RepID=A0A8B8SZC1_CAMFR|nr:uncharacterized protein LOC116663350 [Camelus ferus]
MEHKLDKLDTVTDTIQAHVPARGSFNRMLCNKVPQGQRTSPQDCTGQAGTHSSWLYKFQGPGESRGPPSSQDPSMGPGDPSFLTAVTHLPGSKVKRNDSEGILNVVYGNFHKLLDEVVCASGLWDLICASESSSYSLPSPADPHQPCIRRNRKARGDWRLVHTEPPSIHQNRATEHREQTPGSQHTQRLNPGTRNNVTQTMRHCQGPEGTPASNSKITSPPILFVHCYFLCAGLTAAAGPQGQSLSPLRDHVSSFCPATIPAPGGETHLGTKGTHVW